MSVVLGFFLVIVICIFSVFIGESYRAHPIMCYVLWLGTPIVITGLRYSQLSCDLLKEEAEWIRRIAIAITIIMSFCLFADSPRPDLWYRSFWFRMMFECGILFLCFAIPIITWKQSTKICERSSKKEEEL